MNKDELESMYFEFAEWLGETHIRATEVWIHRYVNQTNKRNWKTTEELFDFWKTNIYQKG